jgi:hypothetical protein
MTKTPNRQRDLNQWAKRLVDIATGAADQTMTATSPAQIAPRREYLGSQKISRLIRSRGRPEEAGPSGRP